LVVQQKLFEKMKITIQTLVVLSALAVTTTAFAQSKASPPANYKQQNQLIAKKKQPIQSSQIAISNDYATNPLENHRNYKAHLNAPQPATVVFDVKLGNRHRNYKQKNLLTSNGYKEATKQAQDIEQEELVLK
jgi:bifunctional ADP-heptose synthase (sugar kinase/adenylyltransferase)